MSGGDTYAQVRDRTCGESLQVREARKEKVAPGTRAANYRCSLPGLAGFVGFASPRAKTGLAQELSGERGIRTLGTFRYTRFPVVLLRPLGHLSGRSGFGVRAQQSSRGPQNLRFGVRSCQSDAAEREGFEPPVPLRVHLISN